MASRPAGRLALVLGLLLVLTLPAFAGLISQEQEIEIGREGSRQLESRYRVIQDLPVQERITRVGQALAAQGSRGIPYHFKVLDVQDINALAFPGGFIYATRGLMEAMPDRELAFVLAHEVTHVEKRHSVQQMEAELYKQIGIGALLTLLGSNDVGQGTVNTVQVADAIVSSHYSQEAEREADHDGMVLMGRAGYDPMGAVAALETLKRNDDGEEVPGFLNSMLGSHPLTSERIETARKLAPEIPYQRSQPAAPQAPAPVEPPAPPANKPSGAQPAPLFTPVP